MAFQFSLAPVLEQRAALENKAQLDYATATGRIAAKRRQRDAYLAEATQRKDEVSTALHKGVTLAWREVLENWIHALVTKAAQAERELHEMIVQAEQLRRKLVKAMQDRAMMDKLRDNEFKEYRIAEERAERRRFDDIAIRNFAMEQHREKSAGCAAAMAERIAG